MLAHLTSPGSHHLSCKMGKLCHFLILNMYGTKSFLGAGRVVWFGGFFFFGRGVLLEYRKGWILFEMRKRRTASFSPTGLPTSCCSCHWNQWLHVPPTLGSGTESEPSPSCTALFTHPTTPPERHQEEHLSHVPSHHPGHRDRHCCHTASQTLG